MRRTLILSAAVALALTACASDDPEDAAGTSATTAEAPADDGGSAEEEAGGTLEVVGTDDLAWEPAEASTTAGTVEVTVECAGEVAHALAIEGVEGDETIADCSSEGPGSATVELEAGDYTFFCTVPGHRDAGMEGTLTVG